MKKPILTALFGATFLLAPTPAPAQMVRALIIDGQNNHAWQQTTPVLKKMLEDTRLFEVDVLTSPPSGGDFKNFKPEFSRYRVVVSNYNDCNNETIPEAKFSVGCPGTGDQWPADVRTAFEQYVRSGGGFVAYHAADNAFPKWPAETRSTPLPRICRESGCTRLTSCTIGCEVRERTWRFWPPHVPIQRTRGQAMMNPYS